MNDTPGTSIVPLADEVYCAYGYGPANVLCIISATSMVVVDTTASPATASSLLDDLREVTPLPVGHVVYSHHHVEQTGGAGALIGRNAKVIAQRQLPHEIERARLLDGLRASNPLSSRAAPETAYVAPDITFDESHRLREDGVEIEILHAPGETLDHSVVWLPRARVVFVADLIQQGFPMLSSPLDPDRPVEAWASSLDTLKELRPRMLVASTGAPIVGARRVAARLAGTAAAIRHVHDETVRAINAGYTVEEAIDEVRLPKSLAALRHLAETHGRVAWAVRGLYRQYCGWYGFNPTELNARPSAARHRTLLQVAGGAAPILDQAQWALDMGDHQLALELTAIVRDLEPNARAEEIRRAGLRALAAATGNTLERQLYEADTPEPRGCTDGAIAEVTRPDH